MNGTDVLLLVNTGTDQTPVWTVVGGQRDVEFSEKVDVIDVSSKDSASRKILPGRYSATVKLDSLYVPSDAAYDALQTAFRGRNKIKVQRQEGGTALEQADAIITELGLKAPDQGEAVISLTLEIDGDWTAAA